MVELLKFMTSSATNFICSFSVLALIGAFACTALSNFNLVKTNITHNHYAWEDNKKDVKKTESK